MYSNYTMEKTENSLFENEMFHKKREVFHKSLQSFISLLLVK